MKLTAAAALTALGAGSGAAAAAAAHTNSRWVHRSLTARAPPSNDILDINNYRAQYYTNGENPIGYKSSDAAGQVVELTADNRSDDASQTAQCSSTIFIGNAANGGTKETGWQSLPALTGFDLKRDLVIDSKSNAVQPYYELAGRDPAKVKRVIIVQPGLPRDSWKYNNLFRNALVCAAANESMGLNLEDVIIAGPAWLNEDDLTAGAAQPSDVLFSKGQWAFGALSKGPGDLTVSSYSVLDALVDKYFDRSTYPAMNQVWIAGHSLGGTLVQHYAMVRKPTRDDVNLNFWLGNPGAYVWPIDDRPARPPSSMQCEDTYNTWPYGMSNKTRDDVVVYRRSDMLDSRDDVLDDYYARRVVTALGLEDDGDGDDGCEAQYQGTTHLNRGQNMERAMNSLPGGKPAKHSFDYIPGVSHQDYRMISAPASLYHLFGENLNVRQATSSGGSGGSKNGNGGGSTTGGSSSTSRAAAQVQVRGRGMGSLLGGLVAVVAVSVGTACFFA